MITTTRLAALMFMSVGLFCLLALGLFLHDGAALVGGKTGWGVVTAAERPAYYVALAAWGLFGVVMLSTSIAQWRESARPVRRVERPEPPPRPHTHPAWVPVQVVIVLALAAIGFFAAVRLGSG